MNKFYKISIYMCTVLIIALFFITFKYFNVISDNGFLLKELKKNKVLVQDKKNLISDRKDYQSIYSEESEYIRVENLNLAKKLIEEAKKKGFIIVCAESVSGGNLAATLARAPGAGSIFAGGSVCYKIEAKKQLLHVPDEKEDELYDLQTAQDMAKGVSKLYNIVEKFKVKNENESFFKKPIFAISTTGRAVTYKNHWEGGVYVGIITPSGEVHSSYFTHNFINSKGQEDSAKTKDEGMLIAANKALSFALKIIFQIK